MYKVYVHINAIPGIRTESTVERGRYNTLYQAMSRIDEYKADDSRLDAFLKDDYKAGTCSRLDAILNDEKEYTYFIEKAPVSDLVEEITLRAQDCTKDDSQSRRERYHRTKLLRHMLAWSFFKFKEYWEDYV